jgi:basic membrane protein A
VSSKFALIIGNTEYIDPGLAQLSAPGKDAEDFARVLKDHDIGAFDEVNILLNEPEPVVRGAIDEFFDIKKPDDLLVLYFSGHGVRDELGSLYLAVKNTIRTRLRSTAVKSDYIREAMDQSRSKRQVLILDCCNSGAFSQGTKAATGVSIGTASAFEAGYGRIILTASDSTQFAWEGNKVIGETDNSLFTHYLIEGLEGEADQDGDGRITVDELYDYAYEKVKLATPKQTPSKFSSKQQGEIVLRQNMRIEDIKPVSLPSELIDEIDDTRPYVREAAVQKLEKIIQGRNIGLARSAREALEKIVADENTTRRVAQAAMQILESIRQKAEEERLAAEKMETEREFEEERVALAKIEAERFAEEKRLAQKKAEDERKAKEEAEQLLAKQMAEEERFAVEKVEAERIAKEKASQLLADQKAEEERIAKAKMEAERVTKEKMEAKRLAEEKRLPAEKAVVVPEKTARPQSVRSQRPFLKWAMMGIIGLCVLATGAWGISYLASLGVTTATETPATAAPVTEMPDATESPATQPADCRDPQLFCIGLVTDIGKINDNSFNQSAWEGVLRAKKELSALVQYIETADSRDYAKNIAIFGDEGFDVIVTVGFSMGEATDLAAAAYPNTNFIGVDQFQATEVPGVAGLNFSEDKAGFLAGALAAMISKSHQIGAVCGTDVVPPVWRFGEGYKAGAVYADNINGTTTDAYVAYHNDVGFDLTFTDPEWGAAISHAMLDEGADVIFGCGALTGNGAITAAAQRGAYVIGVDVDQYYTLPDAAPRMLSSALKLIDQGVFDLIKAAKDGRFPIGNVTGEVGLAPYHDLDSEVSVEVKAEIEAIKVGLSDGSIATNVLPAKP